MTDDLTALVLAAGKGTRMRSSRPKVLHPLAGRSLIAHVLATAGQLGARSSVVVLSPGMDAVAAEALRVAPGSRIVLQEPQAGTGHAVQVARPALPETGVVLVLYGDTPLVSPETLQRLLQAREDEDAAVAVLGMRPPDPGGYGRLLFDAGGLAALVEERHADAALRQGGICNSGVMAIDAARLGMLVEGLTLHPEKNEYYLTDIVARARDLGWRCTAIEGPHEDGLGINSQEQLAAAEAVLQRRLRGRAMAEGVTLIAPETVHLAADTLIAAEAEIGPYVVCGPGVRIGRGVRVLPFSHLEGVVVEDGARIGPFARLRPGTTVGEAAHVGNFVELKAADLGAGAKVNHLAYVGDATVGARANVGAGTIVANYDGFAKHRTEIGAGASIGSNAVLVAPVTIGDGAMVGAGTTVTADVPKDALALRRVEQTNIEGGARRFRARRAPKGGG